jgi:hypothetical protein
MGSIPDEVIEFFNLSNLSSHIVALGSTQPLTELSSRNLSGAKEWLKTSLPSLGPLSTKYGSLNTSQLYRPLWSVGIAYKSICQ